MIRLFHSHYVYCQRGLLAVKTIAACRQSGLRDDCSVESEAPWPDDGKTTGGERIHTVKTAEEDFLFHCKVSTPRVRSD